LEKRYDLPQNGQGKLLEKEKYLEPARNRTLLLGRPARIVIDISSAVSCISHSFLRTDHIVK
jgi:hypothetical protein